jgi:hypothetical protein
MDAIDYELIRQLLGRYNMAIDLGDAEGWAATFTPDGVFRCTGVPEGSPFGGRYEGTDELIAYAKTHFGVAKGRARHWNANLLIEGDGEAATMRCYMLNLTAGAGRLAATTGIYEDRLRKVDGEWRFAERHIAVDDAAS